MSRAEAAVQYGKALKAGQRCYNERVRQGWYPYPPALDEILEGRTTAGTVELGLLDIPLEQVAGTKTAGRKSAFAANFMPLLPQGTEFSDKWINLCDAHLGETGIRDPIKCFEYMGLFYVLEGNKRVSVLKSFDAVTIPGQVTRIIPAWSEDEEVRAYYEFLRFYDLSRVYRVRFRRPGGYAKLQVALGFDLDHVWTEEERSRFLADLARFQKAYDKLNAGKLPVTTAEALLLWLQVYSAEQLHTLSAAELEKALKAIWADVEASDKGFPIEMNTIPEEDAKKGGIGQLLGSVLRPSHLNVAFVYGLPPEGSLWLTSHDQGRAYLEEMMSHAVTVKTYCVPKGENGDAAVEQAAGEGADVVIAPTPQLIFACNKAAAKYPNVRFLNCAVAMPYTGIRTYQSRMYEGAFVAGAIAGAMTDGDRIGYITDSPIFGGPAAINAFALGAQLTSPRSRVRLKWTCLPGDPIRELTDEGIKVIFCGERMSPSSPKHGLGLHRLGPDGTLEPLFRLNWNWGSFYVRLIRSILSGGWDELSAKDRAVSYWWGLGAGVIDVVLDGALPAGVSALASILCAGLIRGDIYVFHRPIRDQAGEVRNDGNQWFNMEKILYMDWLCDYVDGFIPGYDELNPEARSLVRLQGVYRDRILPEKEGTAT